METVALCDVQASDASDVGAGAGAVESKDEEGSGLGSGAAHSMVSGPSVLCMRTVLRGTGKFPHVTIEPVAAELGAVLAGSVGEQVERAVILRNPSQVHCTVVARPVERDRRSHFLLRPTRAVVDGQGGQVPLKLTYRPTVPGSHSVERFQFTAPGGARVTLVARGRAVAPVVTLGRKDREGGGGSKRQRPQVLDFGDVGLDKAPPSHVLRLRNHGAAPVRFGFLSEAGAIFRFSRLQGEIAPHMYVDVSVHFVAREAGNYARRVACLLRGGEPLWVDCIGTVHGTGTGSQRPMPLRDWHYRAWRLRPAPLRLLAPDDVLAVARAHAQAVQAGLDPESALPRAGFPCALTSPWTRAWEESLLLRPGGGADADVPHNGAATEAADNHPERKEVTAAAAAQVLNRQSLSALEHQSTQGRGGGAGLVADLSYGTYGAPRTPMLRDGANGTLQPQGLYDSSRYTGGT